jgi:hypothetical protein
LRVATPTAQPKLSDLGRKTGSQAATPKLVDLGITKTQSSRWQDHDGAIIFADLIGKLDGLEVACEPPPFTKMFLR